MKYLFILFVLGISLTANAQGFRPALDTVRWTSAKDKNLQTGEVLTRSFSFTTCGTKKIVMSNGARTDSFKVTGTQGAWNDFTATGRIVYRVLYGDQSGEITIERRPNNPFVFLILDMSAASASGIHNEYVIEQFTKL